MLTTDSIDRIDQGSILSGIQHPVFHSLKISVVLNPTCLIHNGKADSLILAYLVPAHFIIERNEDIQQHIHGLDEKSAGGINIVGNKKSESIRKTIGKLIDNDEPRRHFYVRGLDHISLPDTFIDFQQVASFPFDQVTTGARILAKLRTPWREKLATHYAGYMMRIGVQRFEGEIREKIVSSMISPIKLTPATQ